MKVQPENETVRSGAETLILSLDTATETRSVAVARGARLLALKEGEGHNTHSANVLSEIDAALEMSGVRLPDIELYAAAAGPGSFTGLRAGLATLKAFAATFERPVVGVPTLHAVAMAAGASGKILAAIPAGRGEVFAQLLSTDGAGRVTEFSAASHVAPERLLELAVKETEAAGLVWAGAGAQMLSASLAERARLEGLSWYEEASHLNSAAAAQKRRTGGWTLAPPSKILAGHISALALDAFRQGRATNANDLHAIYVRPSDAEIKEQCRAPNAQPK